MALSARKPQAQSSHDTRIAETAFKPYRIAGLRYIKSMKDIGPDPCYRITEESPEWQAWTDWFMRRVGRLLPEFAWHLRPMDPLPSVTVPCQFPEYLDATYDAVLADPLSKPNPSNGPRTKIDTPRSPKVADGFKTLQQAYGSRPRD
jgi:hypothetical protein